MPALARGSEPGWADPEADWRASLDLFDGQGGFLQSIVPDGGIERLATRAYPAGVGIIGNSAGVDGDGEAVLYTLVPEPFPQIRRYRIELDLPQDGFKSPVAKFLGEELVEGLCEATGTDDAGFRFCWVVEFPLLEPDEESGRNFARHHPFTSPHPDDVESLESDPLAVRARSYDLVLNGVELGGGSIRIHRSDVQRRVFAALGMDAAESEAQFGFLLDALKYGAPPHGGIAMGLDGIVMMLAGEGSLRSVTAFPKTASATDLMTDAPAPVEEQQLDDLHIALKRVESPDNAD